MHIFSNIANAATPFGVTQTGNRNAQTGRDWAAGDVITATLTEVKNGSATLRTPDDYTFQAAGDAIRGQVGDLLTFQVVKNDRQGLSLKQIFEPKRDAQDTFVAPQQEVPPTFEIKSFTKTINALGDEEKQRTETQQEAQQKAARAIARIQRAQQFMTDSASPSALAALLESGLSLNKVSFAMMYRVMREVDKRPPHAAAPEDGTTPRPAEQSLRRHGLPPSERNIAALNRAWDSLPKEVDDHTLARMVADESEMTVEKLYKSRYAAPGASAHAPDDPAWDAWATAVQKHFGQEGIDATEENIKAARFLLSHDLPIDGRNVEKIVFLRRLNETLSPEMFYDKAAQQMAKHQPITDLPLSALTQANNGRTGTQDALVIETASAYLSTEDTHTLRRALGNAPDIKWPERITARRALAEVQLKFTAEAATRLRGHMPIETDALRDALQHLTHLEQESYARYLRMAGGNNTAESAESVSRMTALYDTLADIRPLTTHVHADILRNRAEYTLNGLHESILAARAQAGYETFATVPNPRYGDAFAKVRSQFGAVLTDLGIADTAENIKAAFILSKNNMDITWEQLQAVKEIDAQINTVTERLHPMIAAQMIKEGLQPLDMQVEQVLAYIRQYKQTFGEDGGDKIARYIRDMDDQKAFDADTRKSMIAVYRMLHVIQKDGAAALGLAVKQDAPLTLGGLMELSKYYEKQKKAGGSAVFDQSVDDAFGYLERVTRPSDNIRSILESAGSAKQPVTYTDLITDQFIDSTPPERLRALLQEDADGISSALEDLIHTDISPAPPEEAAAQLRTMTTASPGLLAFMQNQQIAATPGMLRAMEKVSRSPRAMTEALTALDNETADAVAEDLPDSDLQPLREGKTPAQIWAGLLSALEEAASPVDRPDMAERIDEARRIAALRGHLNQEKNFQIPLRLRGGLSHLNLYVLNEQALLDEGARIFMSLDTPGLGPVQGFFSIKEGAVDLRIAAETPQAVAQLQADQESLHTFLAEAGLTLGDLSFTLAETRTPYPTEALASAHSPKEAQASANNPMDAPLPALFFPSARPRGLSEYEYLV